MNKRLKTHYYSPDREYYLSRVANLINSILEIEESEDIKDEDPKIIKELKELVSTIPARLNVGIISKLVVKLNNEHPGREWEKEPL